MWYIYNQSDFGVDHLIVPMCNVLKVLVIQSCPTFWDPMDYSPPGSSVHGILQAKILETQNTKILENGCHSLLQGIFPTPGSNPGLPLCRQILYHLSHQRILSMCRISHKNNEFQSVLVKWVNLKPIKQSEVSLKEKNKYRILTYMYGIQKSGIDYLFAGKTQMQRTDLWTQWGKKNVGQMEKVALTFIHYHV